MNLKKKASSRLLFVVVFYHGNRKETTACGKEITVQNKSPSSFCSTHYYSIRAKSFSINKQNRKYQPALTQTRVGARTLIPSATHLSPWRADLWSAAAVAWERKDRSQGTMASSELCLLLFLYARGLPVQGAKGHSNRCFNACAHKPTSRPSPLLKQFHWAERCLMILASMIPGGSTDKESQRLGRKVWQYSDTNIGVITTYTQT